jgi:threonine aldolase
MTTDTRLAGVVDLRSDTITQPTPAMRRVLAEAEVGDDVLGDDPTVHRLEERVAGILGKEAAVFVPSGTMGNQVAIRAQTEPGDEILVEANAHLFFYESGGPAALAGVMCRCLAGSRGLFTAAELEAAIRPMNLHYPPTRLVCLENTHNRGGGSIWPLHQLQSVATAARHHGLRLHLDGARLWNASVAAGVAERNYAEPFDSVSVCFSKGLGAPAGSALAGSLEFIQRARRFRKQFGGAMRQAGILAAAALHAIDHHRERLAEDHAHARRLADGLSDLPGLEVDPRATETNMVLVGLTERPATEVVAALAAAGVRVLATGPRTLRAVTSLMVNAADIESAIARFKSVMRSHP